MLTAAAPLAQCSRIALNGDTPARITQTAGEMALLQPELRIAPTAVARFATPQDGAAITGAGYPYGHTLAQASTTPGQITALDGLTGTADHLRLTMQATAGDIGGQPPAGDIGGPLLDAGGDVVGMLLPQTAGLPQTVQIAASSGAIARLINAPAPLAVISAPIAPEAVSTRARLITAQISCW
ncbi:trypsin-like peptidase domain-containing protein [Ketogulonicigenium vulgare]|uniref:trypsin-like peptidase domain-containing protein n=1 Tax=Ketogulonicigenium vulgare TaxID=92945 RepID=UPI000305368B|nr:trypsin-like peptidase domain-containing protein [Ketogulonicigenium vulgare]